MCIKLIDRSIDRERERERDRDRERERQRERERERERLTTKPRENLQQYLLPSLPLSDTDKLFWT